MTALVVSRRKAVVVLVHLMVVCLISAGAFAVATDRELGVDGFTLMTWVSILTSIWLFVSWRLIGRQIFSVYGLFVVFALMFNLGQVLINPIGLNPNGVLGGRVSQELVALSVVAVVLALVWMHLGALVWSGPKSGTGTAGELESDSVDEKVVRVIGVVLIIVSFVPVVLMIIEGMRVVIASGYLGLFQVTTATGVEASGRVLAGFAIPGIMFCYAGFRRDRPVRWLLVALLLVYSTSLLFLGSRSHAVLPLVALIWLHGVLVKRITLSRATTIGLFLLGVIAPVVKSVRGASGGDRVSIDTWVNAVETLESPIGMAVNEFGGSMATVAYTLDFVPRERPFGYGVGYAYAATTVIPNIFGDLHPAIAHGTASDWLIGKVDPYTASMGGGIGYSFIAELFLQFGWLGLSLGAFLLGLIVAQADKVCRRTRRLVVVAGAASFLPSLLFFARGESAQIFRTLAWYWGLPVLICAVLLGKRRRRHVGTSQRTKDEAVPRSAGWPNTPGAASARNR